MQQARLQKLMFNRDYKKIRNMNRYFRKRSGVQQPSPTNQADQNKTAEKSLKRSKSFRKSKHKQKQADGSKQFPS